MNTTGTVVIGAGQAGLALSHFLTVAGHRHAVVERGRIGERWRSERWESLTLLTPNWLNQLPGSEQHADPEGHLTTRELVEYFERYAASFDAPLAEGTSVLSVEQAGHGFTVRTDAGTWRAGNVVVATGDCDVPLIPSVAGAAPAGVGQLHARNYRSPDQLPPGGVLVVGSGPTGQQLALELRRSGRDMTIAVGRHTRSLRRYRGRDAFDWMLDTGDLHRSVDELPDVAAAMRAPSHTLTGSNGGEQLDMGVLHRLGVEVAGRLLGFSGAHAIFADDLAQSLAGAERRLHRFADKADGLIGSRRNTEIEPLDLPAGRTELNLRTAGVATILWGTGYSRSYPWLRVPVVGEHGEIEQRRGVTRVPGLYTLGRKLQTRRSSHFIGGVGEDAAEIAERILGHASAVPHAA